MPGKWHARSRGAWLAALCLLPWTFVAIGCSTSPTRPDAPDSTDTVGELIAVSLPENVAAGDTATIWIHVRSVDCTARFLRMDERSSGSSALELRPLVRGKTGAICVHVPESPPGFVCTTPCRVWVPSSGSTEIRLFGASDTMLVRLAPEAGPVVPEYRVEFVPRSIAGTAAGIPLEWWAWQPFGAAPAESLGAAVTDAHGVARAVVSAIDPPRDTWAVFYGSGRALPPSILLRAGREMNPSGQGIRTIVPYGQPSAPSAAAVGWRSRAAMYSAGSPWWRNPAAMALR